MDRLYQTSETATVNYDRERFCLQGDGDEYLDLNECHKVYCDADDESRTRLLSDIARMWFRQDYTLPDEFEDATHDLMPYVHSRGFFELSPQRWPYQVLGEHLGATIVYGRLESRQLVPKEILDAWGVSLDQALEIAKENLRRLPANVAIPNSDETAWYLKTGDDRCSAYLLLTDIVRLWDVRGDAIAMVPNRDTLFIAGSEDDKSLAQMVKIAMAASEFPRPISGIALRLADDTWVPWLPAESHPLHRDFKQLQLRTFEAEYAEQEKLLDKRCEETGQDVYVAPFWCLTSPKGKPASATGWPAGVESMLPETDVIMFMRNETDSAIVTWQGAVSIVGNLMEPLNMYPPRCRVREFPSPEQLAWMVSEHSAEG